MTRVHVRLHGFENIDAAILQFGPSFANRLLGPSLLAAARVVRAAARKRDFGFTDRTGRLRQSIHAAGTGARYFGRRYKRGRAGVFAGGRYAGAAQAHLVERGHAGPRPARPHPYLSTALEQTFTAQAVAFEARARTLFNRLLIRYTNPGAGADISRRSFRSAFRNKI